MACPGCGRVLDPKSLAVFGKEGSDEGMVLCTCGASSTVRKAEPEKRPSDVDAVKFLGSRMDRT